MNGTKAQELRRNGNRRRPTPVDVVTGASAGVGRAVAIVFGRHGYAVALRARGKAWKALGGMWRPPAAKRSSMPASHWRSSVSWQPCFCPGSASPEGIRIR